MSHRHLIFLLLLSLTVGIKLMFGVSTRDADERAAAKAAISDFLSHREFSIDHADNHPGSRFVSASKGECHLQIAAVAPQGWNRDAIWRQSKPNDRVFFIVNDVIYRDQPTWQTWAGYYWRQLNHYVGRQVAAHPPLGAIASPDCDVWREFLQLP
jgi:hypothetical protein